MEKDYYSIKKALIPKLEYDFFIRFFAKIKRWEHLVDYKDFNIDRERAFLGKYQKF